MRRYALPVSLLALVLGASLTLSGATRSSEIASPQVKVARGTQPRHPQRAADSPKPSPSPSPSPTTSSPAPLQRCKADKMRLTVALSGSTMSQPFDDISITNVGKRECVLTGYPQIAVAGHHGWPSQPAPSVPVGITVHHRIYERVDPGPHRVVVPPQHQVFYSIGTVDAYDGPMFTLTRLTVILPGTRRPKALPVSLLANGLPGRKVPRTTSKSRRRPGGPVAPARRSEPAATPGSATQHFRQWITG